eukprot:m.488292 g.488292  ORF g.488292 m.488292 type:complete len:419 (+) comp25694_c0_seq1:29-1285(+)
MSFDLAIELSEKQRSKLKKAFETVAHGEEKLAGADLEALITSLFKDNVAPERVASVVSAAGDGVTASQFVLHMQQLLGSSTFWGLLNTGVRGDLKLEAIHSQRRRALAHRGLEFNVMVVGRSGLGKSSFLNTLYQALVSRSKCSPTTYEPVPSTTEVHKVTHVIKEGDVQLKLGLIDTPGFGDLVDNSGCHEVLVSYINARYQTHMDVEMDSHRDMQNLADNRVHACLYFIEPTGHRLSQLDIQCLKALHDKVNVIPVIARCDTLTNEEKLAFKERVKEDLDCFKIQTFSGDGHGDEEGDEVLDTPYAVVAANFAQKDEQSGAVARGRMTRCGFVDLEDARHSDFARLRRLLIETHCQQLIDTTHYDKYEKYRVSQMDASVAFATQEDGPDEDDATVIKRYSRLDLLEAQQGGHESDA